MSEQSELTMRRAENVGGLFRNFYNCWGPTKMLEAYDWEEPPKQARLNEKVFEFVVLGTVGSAQTRMDIGYGSLTVDTLDETDFRLSLGIFPNYTGKGYRKQMVYKLAEHAFAELGAKKIRRFIVGNDPVRMAMMSRACEDTPWRYAGHHWYPDPPEAMFATTREAWTQFYQPHHGLRESPDRSA